MGLEIADNFGKWQKSLNSQVVLCPIVTDIRRTRRNSNQSNRIYAIKRLRICFHMQSHVFCDPKASHSDATADYLPLGEH